ncbi:MAG: hypothetical protein GXO28_01105 [Methanopyri archaeon]|nr:hypothetical protein [Methanopyri archaeon]
MLDMKDKKRHEGEIPRDYRICSRDPFGAYFPPRHKKPIKLRKSKREH